MNEKCFMFFPMNEAVHSPIVVVKPLDVTVPVPASWRDFLLWDMMDPEFKSKVKAPMLKTYENGIEEGIVHGAVIETDWLGLRNAPKVPVSLIIERFERVLAGDFFLEDARPSMLISPVIKVAFAFVAAAKMKHAAISTDPNWQMSALALREFPFFP